jgi:hypothetical protein
MKHYNDSVSSSVDLPLCFSRSTKFIKRQELHEQCRRFCSHKGESSAVAQYRLYQITQTP